jgi:hypothetical protein
MAVAGGLAVTVGPAVASTPQPTLRSEPVIHTTPFSNRADVRMRDNEGSAYVPRDHSLWLVDDDSHRLYEVNPTTGNLKRVIDKTVLTTVRKFGGGPQAGALRSKDLESMAYDAATDTLYAFSGNNGVSQPAAFRLKRRNGVLRLVDYQPLPATSDFTGAAWNSAQRKIYVGLKSDLRTYTYATNKAGPVFKISGVHEIQGLDFSADGSELYVASRVLASGARWLTEVDWRSRKMSWRIDLTGFGLDDARGVALIDGSFYVSDGSDVRPPGPTKDAVFVLSGGPATPAVDFKAPQATLTRAASARSAVASWRVLKGRASDAGSGVDRVLLRIVEKRGAAWFAYRGPSHSWVKAGATRARAMKLSRLAAVAPSGTAWTYSVANLKKGHLVVKVSARDHAGNVSGARVYEQSLTR